MNPLEKIRRLRPSAVVTIALVAIPFLGFLDYLTGPDMGFSIFYLFPLSLVAWVGRRRDAFLLAVVAAGVWLAADLAAGVAYSTLLIPVWNTMTRLAVFVFVSALLANLQSAHALQERLARSDSLTGISNSATFAEVARELIVRARRERFPVTVAFIDLDDFKSVNDQLGHAAGDYLLKRVATVLSEKTRATDLVARLGGDEFGILAPGMGSQAAKVAMEGLAVRLREQLQDQQVSVTFSAGCVTFLKAPANVDEMITASDNLMYVAKRAGKNRFEHVVVATDDSWEDVTVDLRE